jgi:prepilin-type processing-associated H-X9-DG protein
MTVTQSFGNVPSDNPANMQTYQWAVSGDLYSGETLNGQISKGISAHLKNGKIPLGANIGMLDGHGEWHTFQQLRVRFESLPLCSFYY